MTAVVVSGEARHRRLLVTAALVAALAVAASAVPLLLAGVGATVAVALVGVAAVVGLAVLLAGRAAAVRRRASTVLDGATALLVLVVVVAAAQLVTVLLAGRRPTADERWWFLPTAGAAAVAAVAFAPVRRRATDAARHLAVGEQRDPEDVVRTFGDRASRGVADGELLLQLAESLHRALRLSRAEVWTGVGGWLERVVAVPDQPAGRVELAAAVQSALANSVVVGEAWLRLWVPALADHAAGAEVRVVAAVHSGEVLGLVLVERSSAHDRFTVDEDLALGELGRRLGVVLHNRRLDATLESTLDDLRRTNDELRASRARLVAVADAERRRLERDLHDGAQQHLVALAVNLRVARDLMATDPEAAAALLDQQGDAVRTTIAELRALAHGIYPPLLRDAGLVEALRAAADRQAQPVRLETDLVGRYPADVEAAVYFCCLEALQNAAKHAAEATVTLRLHEEAGGAPGTAVLHLEVADDGPGFDPGAVQLGSGLRHLADRLGAVGGTVQWASAPGAGTRVHGTVPVVPEVER